MEVKTEEGHFKLSYRQKYCPDARQTLEPSHSSRVKGGMPDAFLDHSIHHVIARDAVNPMDAFYISMESVDSVAFKYRSLIINA